MAQRERPAAEALPILPLSRLTFLRTSPTSFYWKFSSNAALLCSNPKIIFCVRDASSVFTQEFVIVLCGLLP